MTMTKIACIQHDKHPGRPKDGFLWICDECFNTMDSYAWVAKEIEKEIKKNGTITLDCINNLFKISFDTKRRFDNFHAAIQGER
jgi:hypothetical protein